MTDVQVVSWRRLDVFGLEQLELRRTRAGVTATATTTCAEDGGFRIDHVWRLTPDWSVSTVEVTKHGRQGEQRLRLAREGHGWLVDGVARPDLDGTDEPDLSITPWCNTFPIRALAADDDAALTLDTCYIDAATMRVVRSRQRYERIGPRQVRYTDLGTAAGFEAVIDVDDDGLVIEYEGLFRRVDAGTAG